MHVGVTPLPIWLRLWMWLPALLSLVRLFVYRVIRDWTFMERMIFVWYFFPREYDNRNDHISTCPDWQQNGLWSVLNAMYSKAKRSVQFLLSQMQDVYLSWVFAKLIWYAYRYSFRSRSQWDDIFANTAIFWIFLAMHTRHQSICKC